MQFVFSEKSPFILHFKLRRSLIKEVDEKYAQLADDLQSHLKNFLKSVDYIHCIYLPGDIKLMHEIKEVFLKQINTILQTEMKKWCDDQEAGKSWENVIQKITNTVKEYEISQAQVEVPWARQAQTPVIREESTVSEAPSSMETASETESKLLFTKGIKRQGKVWFICITNTINDRQCIVEVTNRR